MSSGGVVVAEEGNRRVGEMTKDEVEQCVLDIKSWFQRSSRALDDVNPATSTDFQRLAKAVDAPVPFALRALLSECNGGIWLMEKKLLGVEEIIDTVCRCQSSREWKDDMIPIAVDGSGGDALLVYCDGTQALYEWEEDSGLGPTVSPSLNRFLEQYRNHLLDGRYEFDEDIGMIEKVGAGAGSAGASSSNRK